MPCAIGWISWICATPFTVGLGGAFAPALRATLSREGIKMLRAYWAVVFLTLSAAGLRAQTVTATLAAGTQPYAGAVNPVTNTIYVANSDSHNVTVIHGAAN